MKKKLLIGTIVVFGIAAAIFMNMLVAGALIVVWIYLVFMVWKKKTKIFQYQMEPKLAERRYKRLKTFLLVAGISFAMWCVTIFVGDVILDLTNEEPVFFLSWFFSAVLFIIATIGSLVIFLKGRLKTT